MRTQCDARSVVRRVDHRGRARVGFTRGDAEVVDALRTAPATPQLKDTAGFHRLVAAGVMIQTNNNEIAYMCELYRKYLNNHLLSNKR